MDKYTGKELFIKITVKKIELSGYGRKIFWYNKFDLSSIYNNLIFFILFILYFIINSIFNIISFYQLS